MPVKTRVDREPNVTANGSETVEFDSREGKIALVTIHAEASISNHQVTVETIQDDGTYSEIKGSPVAVDRDDEYHFTFTEYNDRTRFTFTDQGGNGGTIESEIELHDGDSAFSVANDYPGLVTEAFDIEVERDFVDADGRRVPSADVGTGGEGGGGGLGGPLDIAKPVSGQKEWIYSAGTDKDGVVFASESPSPLVAISHSGVLGSYSGIYKFSSAYEVLDYGYGAYTQQATLSGNDLSTTLKVSTNGLATFSASTGYIAGFRLLIDNQPATGNTISPKSMNLIANVNNANTTKFNSAIIGQNGGIGFDGPTSLNGSIAVTVPFAPAHRFAYNRFPQTSRVRGIIPDPSAQLQMGFTLEVRPQTSGSIQSVSAELAADVVYGIHSPMSTVQSSL
jgi:hypothetical protein